jgi:hypothetical protein
MKAWDREVVTSVVELAERGGLELLETFFWGGWDPTSSGTFGTRMEVESMWQVLRKRYVFHYL